MKAEVQIPNNQSKPPTKAYLTMVGVERIRHSLSDTDSD